MDATKMGKNWLNLQFAKRKVGGAIETDLYRIGNGVHQAALGLTIPQSILAPRPGDRMTAFGR